MTTVPHHVTYRTAEDQKEEYIHPIAFSHNEIRCCVAGSLCITFTLQTPGCLAVVHGHVKCIM